MLFDHRLRFISAIAEIRKYQIYSEYAPYTYIEDLKEFIDNEKAVLREKMDAYCTKETGLSLDDFCDSLMEMESTETLGLKM